MRIYLVQHGEAVDKTVDPDRPLSARGHADVESIAQRLAVAGAAPEKIHHSGKTRARQTAEIFAGVLKTAADAGEVPGIAPLDSAAGFARRLPELGGETMICGHQPFMGRLVSHLLTGSEERTLVAYSPGSVAILEQTAEGSWILCGFVRPEMCRRE